MRLHLFYRALFERPIKDKIKQMLCEVAPSKKPASEQELNQWVTWVEEIVRERNLIAIYDAELGEDLDSSILKVLFAAGGEERTVDRGMGELKLAITWNRIDMVQETLFSERESRQMLTQEDYQYLMPVALHLDRVEFVKAFLERGLAMKKFLTVNQLILLYNKAV